MLINIFVSRRPPYLRGDLLLGNIFHTYKLFCNMLVFFKFKFLKTIYLETSEIVLFSSYIFRFYANFSLSFFTFMQTLFGYEIFFSYFQFMQPIFLKTSKVA